MLPFVQLSQCTVIQLKNKVKNLKAKYIATIQWRNQTGQGVLESEGESSFQGVTELRCPNFESLDEIYGTKANINPPCVMETDLPDIGGTQENSGEHSVGDATNGDQRPDLNNREPDPSPQSTPKPPLGRKVLSHVGGAMALADARNQKTALDIKRAELEFEKTKWQDELDLKNRQLKLEEQRVQNDADNAKLEIELEYKTQLEIVKLSKE